MRKFAGEWVSAVLTRLGMEEGEAIESKLVSRRIEGAQKKVEERNFDSRKNLLEYDEVMDEQRKRIYSFRQRLLDGAPPKDAILDMIDDQIRDAVQRFLADDYGAASFAEWVGQRLGVELARQGLQGRRFRRRRRGGPAPGRGPAHRDRPRGRRGEPPRRRRPVRMDLAVAGDLGQQPLRPEPQGKRPQAVRHATTATTSSSTATGLEEFLDEKAAETNKAVDLEPAREFLREDWGRNSLAGWLHHKFGIAVDPAGWAGLTKADVTQQAPGARPPGSTPARRPSSPSASG